MSIKKIEEMDYYEILNLNKNASPNEIERAYHLGKAIYKRDSLAHYGLLSDKERWYILRKIEEAYYHLNDPEQRKVYSLNMKMTSSKKSSRTKFRKSTQRLEIVDAEEKKNLWNKIKFHLFSPKKRKNPRVDPDSNIPK